MESSFQTNNVPPAQPLAQNVPRLLNALHALTDISYRKANVLQPNHVEATSSVMLRQEHATIAHKTVIPAATLK